MKTATGPGSDHVDEKKHVSETVTGSGSYLCPPTQLPHTPSRVQDAAQTATERSIEIAEKVRALGYFSTT